MLIGYDHEDRTDASTLEDTAYVCGILFATPYHKQRDDKDGFGPDVNAGKEPFEIDIRFSNGMDREIR